MRVQIPFHYLLAQCPWESFFTMFIKGVGHCSEHGENRNSLKSQTTLWNRNCYYPNFTDEETRGRDRVVKMVVAGFQP